MNNKLNRFIKDCNFLYWLLYIAIIILFVLIQLYHEEAKKEITEIKKTEIPYVCVGDFSITHYCHCKKCTGNEKKGKTFTGYYPKEGRTIAVDPKVIPLHSIVYIEGIGYFVAEDIGEAIKGNHIDIYVENHEKAIKLGTLNNNKKKVYIMKEVLNAKANK